MNISITKEEYLKTFLEPAIRTNWEKFGNQIKKILGEDEGKKFEINFCKEIAEGALSNKTIQIIQSNESLKYFLNTFEKSFDIYMEDITKPAKEELIKTLEKNNP